MGIQQELITALRASSAWQRPTYILTYDESAGTSSTYHPRNWMLTAWESGSRPG